MATIDDVARRAGVSPSTVSYVLSGKRSISEGTRKRVERAVRDLNYRPHAGARALASARTSILGLAAPLRAGVDVNVVMEFVAGVAQGARDHDYDVLLLTQVDGASLNRVIGASMIDGLVVMDIEADDSRLPLLRASTIPAVLIGLPNDPNQLTCVDLDFHMAGALAARHLVDHGHRALAFLGPAQEVFERRTSFVERSIRGFSKVCAVAGADVQLMPVDASIGGASAAVDALLDQTPPVTGIVVHNEAALAHVIHGLEDRGRDVPDGMSIVAICPENTVLALPHPVTSIDIPGEHIGRLAVEMVITKIVQPGHPETRLIGPVLTDRGSVTSV